MYYPSEVIEEVKVKNDTVDMISGYMKLQRKGVNYFDPCPFHDKRSPSFSVLPRKQMYYCFGYGTGDNVITFLMEYENYTFQEALSFLADRAGVNLPKMEYSREAREQADLRVRFLEVDKLVANYFCYQMEQPQGRAAHDYFRPKRGLTDETIVHFGLGYFNRTGDDLHRYLKGEGHEDSFLKNTGLMALEERGGRDKFQDHVMLPIMDVNNRVIGFDGRTMGDKEPRYLSSLETELSDKSHNLCGLNYVRLSREGHLLICKGYLDIVPLRQIGPINAVVSLGTAFTSRHANVLKRYADQVILTYSSDGVGVKTALKAIPILKEAGMSIKVLNVKPYKDPGEFIKNMGAEAFRQRIREAKNSFPFGVDALQRGYKMGDPEQKIGFYQETARKLPRSGEVLKRENYLQVVAREQMIPAEELKSLANRMGMSMGLKASESLNHSDRVVPQETQEEGSGGNGLSGSRRPRRPDKEDGIRRSQRLSLAWLIETPALFEKIGGIITADNFVENLYHQVAQVVSDGHGGGNLSPAAIFSQFTNDEGQYKEMVALLNVGSKESLNNEEQKKAFPETVMKVRESSPDVASHNVKDITQLQEIIRQQAALKQLYISLDWQYFIGRMDRVMEGTDVSKEKLIRPLKEAKRKKDVLECQGATDYFGQEPPVPNQLDRLFEFLDQNKTDVICMGTEDELDPDLFIEKEMELNEEEEIGMKHLDLSVPEGVNLEGPVRMHLKETGKVPLLDMEGEMELVKKMELGDPEARKRLAEFNLRLMVNIAEWYVSRGVQFLGLTQGGNPGLIIAFYTHFRAHET